MTETRRLKNVVIFIQSMIYFVIKNFLAHTNICLKILLLLFHILPFQICCSVFQCSVFYRNYSSNGLQYFGIFDSVKWLKCCHAKDLVFFCFLSFFLSSFFFYYFAALVEYSFAIEIFEIELHKCFGFSLFLVFWIQLTIFPSS